MDDLKPLLAFAAVLEHGSMNAAAQALGMTPSAVSQHISRLEKLHGVKLLHRSTRRLAPTDAGQALAAHCRRLLATVQDTARPCTARSRTAPKRTGCSERGKCRVELQIGTGLFGQYLSTATRRCGRYG